MHKYRGKRIDGGGWVEGDLLTTNNATYIVLKDSVSFRRIDEHGIGCIEFMEDYFVKVDPATVGQATGLKDKNETEAYNDDGASILITDELMKSSFGNSNLAQFVRDNSITECIVQMKPSKCLSVDYTCYFKKGNDFITYSDMGVGDGTIFTERAYDVEFLRYFLSSSVILPNIHDTKPTTNGNK
jgi:hypothetical protein